MNFNKKNIKQLLNQRILYTLVYVVLISVLLILTNSAKNKIDRVSNALYQNITSIQQMYISQSEFLITLPKDNDFIIQGENDITREMVKLEKNIVDTIETLSGVWGLNNNNNYRELKDSTIILLNSYLRSFNELKLAHQQRGNLKAGLLSDIQKEVSDLLLFSGINDETRNSLTQVATNFNSYLGDNKKEYLISISSILDDAQYALSYSNNTENENTEVIDNTEIINKLILLQGKINQLQIVDERIGLYNESTGYLASCKNNFDLTNQTYMMLAKKADQLIEQKRKLSNIVFILLVIVLSVVYILTLRKTLKLITTPLTSIKDVLTQISKGNLNFKSKQDKTTYEFGEINESIELIKNSLVERRSFVDSLLKQKYELNINLLGRKDVFGKTLIALKENMRKSREEQIKHNEDNKIRRYNNEGLAKFAEILRTNNDNIEKLADNFIREFVKYLNALQGSLFMVEEENDYQLTLASAFAYDRKKYLQKSIPLGEGLVGTCGIEKKTIYLTDIPRNYISITSGLGDAPPDNLLLIPVVQDNELAGVIEIASLNKFKKYEIALAENIASSLAATILAVKSNAKTSELLTKSQEQAMEMIEQEEEMRQNMEELKATQEDMKRKQEALEQALQKSEQSTIELEEREAEMAQQRKTLQEILDNIPKSIYLKDRDLKFMVCNRQFAQDANLSPEDTIGKSDEDMMWSDNAKMIQAQDKKVLESGQAILNDIVELSDIDGSIKWYDKSLLPIKDESGEIVAVLGMSEEITDRKNQEEEFKKSIEEFKAIQEEMIEKHKELEKAIQYSERQSLELEKRDTDLNESRRTLQDVMNSMPHAVYLKNINSKYIGSNQAFADFVGKNLDEIIDKDDFDMPWKESADSYRQDDMNVFATGKSKLNVVERQIDKDGQLHWIESSKIPLRDQGGKVIALLGRFEDITEQLNRQDEYNGIASLLNNSVYLIEYNPDAVITKVNNRLAAYLGLKEDDIIGKKHWEVFGSKTKLDKTFFQEFKVNQVFSLTEQLEINNKQLELTYNITSYKVQTEEKVKLINLINFNT